MLTCDWCEQPGTEPAHRLGKLDLRVLRVLGTGS